MVAAAVFVIAACLLACVLQVEGEKWQPTIPQEVCIRSYVGPLCISHKPHSKRRSVKLYECLTPGLNKWNLHLVDSTPNEDGALYNIKDSRNGHCLYPDAHGGEVKNGTAVSEAPCDDLSYGEKTWFVQWCHGRRRGWTFFNNATGYWLSHSGPGKHDRYRPVVGRAKVYWRLKDDGDKWVGVNAV